MTKWGLISAKFGYSWELYQTLQDEYGVSVRHAAIAVEPLPKTTPYAHVAGVAGDNNADDADDYIVLGSLRNENARRSSTQHNVVARPMPSPIRCAGPTSSARPSAAATRASMRP